MADDLAATWEFAERDVSFYDQRPTGKYWARTDAAFLAPKSEPETAADLVRQRFDSALNVLLIRENLAGTKWAIQQLRWEASISDPETDRLLSGLADRLEAKLDKRTAELACRD